MAPSWLSRGGPPGRFRPSVAAALLTALIAFYVISVLRFAWIGDDAFITLRTVDNCGRGYGLTWNTDERVQSYTHPLWMLLLLLAHLGTGELYFTAIAVGFLVSMATVALFIRKIAPSPSAAAVGMAFFCGSRAFIDYSTSGLENPLTHLLIVAFWIVWARGRPADEGAEADAEPWAPRGLRAAIRSLAQGFRSRWRSRRAVRSLPRALLARWRALAASQSRAPDPRRLFFLSLIAALAACNRMDTVLLFAPVLLVEAATDRSRRGLSALALGFAPLFAWEVFSLVYYGALVPNTAYAKLNTGILKSVLWRQGCLYVFDSLSRDPTTLIAVLTAGAAVILRRRFRDLPLYAGVLVYLYYTVKVGGDFMSGRFFTGPLVIAVILLSRSMTAGLPRTLERVAFVLFTAIPGDLSGWLDGPQAAVIQQDVVVNGVADERRYYFGGYGMVSVLRGEGPVRKRLPAPDEGDPRVVLRGDIGFGGLTAGPKVHIVDTLALSDPLLARLPSHQTWRIGHYGRVVPWGYVETLQTGQDHFIDRDLAKLFEKVSLVTRGPIFSGQRWAEIWRLNTGAYSDLVDWNLYRDPPSKAIARAKLPGRKALNGRWDAPGNVLLYRNGARVSLDRPAYASRVRVGFGCGTNYRLVFYLAEAIVTEQKVDLRRCRQRTIGESTFDIDRDAAQKGYDAIMVYPMEENGQSSIGELSLL